MFRFPFTAADASGIAVITQLHPITVLFAIPQDAVPQVMKQFKPAVHVVEAYDRTGGPCWPTGKLVTVDNQSIQRRARSSCAPSSQHRRDAFPQPVCERAADSRIRSTAPRRATAAIQRSATATYVYSWRTRDRLGRLVEDRPVGAWPDRRFQGPRPWRCCRGGRVDKLRDGSRSNSSAGPPEPPVPRHPARTRRPSSVDQGSQPTQN